MKLIYANWFDIEKIKTQTIKDSFLYCWISNNINGCENELFKGFALSNECGFIEDSFNNNGIWIVILKWKILIFHQRVVIMKKKKKKINLIY